MEMCFITRKVLPVYANIHFSTFHLPKALCDDAPLHAYGTQQEIHTHAGVAVLS